jgi:hypothetical protein
MILISNTLKLQLDDDNEELEELTGTLVYRLEESDHQAIQQLVLEDDLAYDKPSEGAMREEVIQEKTHDYILDHRHCAGPNLDQVSVDGWQITIIDDAVVMKPIDWWTV